MRRTLTVALLACLPLLWCGAVPSADPPARRFARDTAEATPDVPMLAVKAPKETIAGKQVKLDASGSNVDSLEWHLVDGPQDDFYVDTDGKHATFGTPLPGVYYFSISGAKLVDGKALAVGAVVKVTLIPDPTKPVDPPSTPPTIPPSNPPTNPPPTTPPTTPPTQPEGFAAWIQRTAESTVVSDPSRAQSAKALAAAYRAWARGAGATTNDPQKFVLGSNKLLDLLLNQAGKQAAWKPFRDALDARLAKLGMTTVQQHVGVWEEIAQGLEAVN